MRRAASRLALVAALTALPSAAAGQTVSWYRFDPLVVPSTSTQPVRLEAAVTGPPSRVALELNSGGTLEMRDDGTGGDTRASDGVFTASVPAATILTALRPDDVQRVFVGFLDVFNGATRVLRGNMFVDVHTPDIDTPSITRLGPDAQATTRVLNLVDPAFLGDGNVRRVAQAFYRLYDDSFDFLNIVSTPTRFLNRSHATVRNDVDGIGLPRSDISSQFGSSGRLRGYSLFPAPNFYDGANVGYSHETGHQWINFLPFAPFSSGVPHWPVSSMATGTMGFSIGGGGGEGGDFRCNVVDDGSVVRLLSVPATEAPIFNDFDRYLMGLIPPEAVRRQVVLPGLTSPPSCLGQTYTGTVTRVGVDAIVAGAGRRVPDVSSSPKRFRAATILVSRDGLVSQEAMWLYTWLTARAELTSSTPTHEGFTKATGNPFFVATGGLASIDTLLSSQPDFSLQAAQAAITVARGAPATFRISAMPTRASFDQEVAFACGTLPAPLTCTFAPRSVTPGASGADVTLTVTTGPAPAAGAVAWPLAGVLLAASAMGRARRARRFAFVVTALAVAACGGSKAPGTQPPPPPGSGATVYNIAVTGTSGSLTHSTTLTLTVQ